MARQRVKALRSAETALAAPATTCASAGAASSTQPRSQPWKKRSPTAHRRSPQLTEPPSRRRRRAPPPRQPRQAAPPPWRTPLGGCAAVCARTPRARGAVGRTSQA